MTNVIQCEKGHYYDASKFSQCPVCSTNPSAVSFGNNNFANQIGATMPLSPAPNGVPGYNGGSVGATMPVDPNAAMNMGAPATAPQTPAFAEETGATMAADILGNGDHEDTDGEVVRPVCGWLVCVEGAKKGKSYEIYSGVTYVGRSDENDIVLNFDQEISKKCLQLSYDVEENEFGVAFVGGKNLVKLNKKTLLGFDNLHDGDVLKLGKSKFVFRALCNDTFKWVNDEE